MSQQKKEIKWNKKKQQQCKSRLICGTFLNTYFYEGKKIENNTYRSLSLKLHWILALISKLLWIELQTRTPKLKMKAFFVITKYNNNKKKKKRRPNHLHSTQSAVFQLAWEQSGKHFCKNISYTKATECRQH